ncbi:uncharacterized protein LOC119309122 [Triticum dicoccoides]|uniref:uncharacterized protein LOC119309122 n=1 Tax=Triticum dicoccoides TaxID=85692 RepID=UPI00189144D4|nr:uncharacterized protein LOC119309122 [Triticum dicoccoides]
MSVRNNTQLCDTVPENPIGLVACDESYCGSQHWFRQLCLLNALTRRTRTRRWPSMTSRLQKMPTRPSNTPLLPVGIRGEGRHGGCVRHVPAVSNRRGPHRDATQDGGQRHAQPRARHGRRRAVRQGCVRAHGGGSAVVRAVAARLGSRSCDAAGRELLPLVLLRVPEVATCAGAADEGAAAGRRG